MHLPRLILLVLAGVVGLRVAFLGVIVNVHFLRLAYHREATWLRHFSSDLRQRRQFTLRLKRRVLLHRHCLLFQPISTVLLLPALVSVSAGKIATGHWWSALTESGRSRRLTHHCRFESAFSMPERISVLLTRISRGYFLLYRACSVVEVRGPTDQRVLY